MSSLMPNPISSHLKEMRLTGMYKGYEEQLASGSYADMSFDDRFSLILQREVNERECRAMQTRIGKARFKDKGAVEDIRPSAARGLDRTLLAQLSRCEWIKDKRNILITGPSGSGKTFLATALTHKACTLGYSARYFRVGNLLAELDATREEGRFIRTVANLSKHHVLIIDDFCLSAITEAEEKDLFELIDERHQRVPTIFTSQNPVNLWHGLMPNPAIADAILDRIVSAAIRVELKGESIRKNPFGDLDSKH